LLNFIELIYLKNINKNNNNEWNKWNDSQTVASNSSIKGNSIKQRLIYPENILDQKTGQQFAEASRMFEEGK